MTSIIFTTEWTGGRQAERQKSMQLEYDLYNGLKVPSIFYWINDDIHDAVHQSECLREPQEWEVIFFFFLLFFFYHPFSVCAAGSSCGWWHRRSPAARPAPSTWSRPRPARRPVMAPGRTPAGGTGGGSSPSLRDIISSGKLEREHRAWMKCLKIVLENYKGI